MRKRALAIMLSMLMAVQMPAMAGELVIEEAVPVVEKITEEDVLIEEKLPEEDVIDEQILEKVTIDDQLPETAEKQAFLEDEILDGELFEETLEDSFITEDTFEEALAEEPVEDITEELPAEEIDTVSSGVETMTEVDGVIEEDEPALVGVITRGGSCGRGLHWFLSADGTLTISGSGDMYDYYCGDEEFDPPWYDLTYQENPDLYPQITGVIIKQGVTSIGDNAFLFDNALTRVIIPDSVISIGDGAFNGCSSLKSVTIPDSVTSIGNQAFADCNSLTSVMIPDSVTSIGESAFRADSLTEILVSPNNSVYSSVNGVLFNKDQSTIIYCPEGKAGQYVIPDCVTGIGGGAFGGCRSLTSVTIGDNVTSIGNSAFGGCDALKSVTIGDSVMSIGDFAFYECTSLTSVTIGDSVTSIGDSAFESCTSLTCVTIPDSVTSIGNEAFENCSALTEISVQINNSVYSSVDGALFDKDQTTIICFPEGKSGAYTIPESITRIGAGIFKNCSALTSITIPNSVTSIGVYAFENCRSLTSLTIPDSVTSIGYKLFYKCTSLTSVTIPDSVTSIDDRSFALCISLKSVTIPDNVTSIGEYAFSNCRTLTSMTIPDSVTNIGGYAFSGCTSINTITFEGDAPWFYGTKAFHYVTATAYYPANNPTWTEDVMQDYGGNITWAPYEPSEVQLYENTLKLPNSTSSIESESFAGLTQGVNIDVPDSVTSIADDAFEDSAVVVIGEAGGYVEDFCNDHEIPFSAR